MIIPDTLSPLPVLPPDGSAASRDDGAPDEFVCERTVRQLLVGPLSAIDPETGLLPSNEEFAGRSDLPSRRETPFVSRRPTPGHADAPAKPFVPRGPHPALSKPRHSAPPRPRAERPEPAAAVRSQERWWVFAMGLGLLMALGAGALIQLFADQPQVAPPVEAQQAPAADEQDPAFTTADAGRP